jgi:hypothetical protein
MVLWRGVDGLVPPIAGIQGAVRSLLHHRVGLGPGVERLPRSSECVVVGHVTGDGVVELGLHLLASYSLHEAVHHQIVGLDDRRVDDGSKLLLGVWVHLHLARGKAITRMPLMLLTARLGAGGRLLLRGCCIHFVRPPRVLIAARGRIHCAVGCGNVLNLARPHALGRGVDLVRHARAVQRMLILRVLWRSVLTEATVAFSVVLNRHVHPILHVQFCLLLLQLALVSHMVGASGARVHGPESIAHTHDLSLVATFVDAGFSIVVIESSRTGLGRGLRAHLSLHVLALQALSSGGIHDALDVRRVAIGRMS